MIKSKCTGQKTLEKNSLKNTNPLLRMRNDASKNGFVSVWLGRHWGESRSQLKLLLMRDMREWGWVQSVTPVPLQTTLLSASLGCCIPATVQERPKALWAYLPWTDRHWLLFSSSQDTLPLIVLTCNRILSFGTLNTVIQNLSQMLMIFQPKLWERWWW